jgi:DUF1016 N-terminal domain
LILQRKESEGWGARLIDKVPVDLRREIPDMSGFLSRNVKYMPKFAEGYTQNEIVEQAAAPIPWLHRCLIVDKIKDGE